MSRRFYRVLDSGEIIKVSTAQLKEDARIIGRYPWHKLTIEDAEYTIQQHSGDPLADSYCFSYNEAKELSNYLKGNKND